MYAASAWWGCTSEADRQLWSELVDCSDGTLFKHIVYNSNHALYQLLPQPSTTVHNLRPRRHNRTLPGKQMRLYSDNFIIGILFKDCYYIIPHHLSSCSVAFCPLYNTSNVTTVTEVRSASAPLFAGMWRPLVSVITTFY